MRRLAAVVCPIVVLTMACGEDAADTTTSMRTTTSATTRTMQSGLSLDSTLVMASPAGVTILRPSGESTEVSTRPASSAYAIGTDFVVFQDGEPDGGAFPAGAGGRIIAWLSGETREVPTDADASRALLLDAAMVNGARVVLLAERFGEVGPDDTFEALVRVDLDDGRRTTIIHRPAWESGHSAARLLPDGDVVGLFTSEAQVLLARWSAMSEAARWTVEVGVDTSHDLTMRDGAITLIQSSFDSSRDFAPVLILTTINETTGDEVRSESVDINDPHGEIDTGLSCRDWASGATLLCGRGGGGAVSVSVDDGSFGHLPSEPGAIPTAVRPV